MLLTLTSWTRPCSNMNPVLSRLSCVNLCSNKYVLQQQVTEIQYVWHMVVVAVSTTPWLVYFFPCAIWATPSLTSVVVVSVARVNMANEPCLQFCSFEPRLPPPLLTAITPATLTAGQHGMSVRLVVSVARVIKYKVFLAACQQAGRTGSPVAESTRDRMPAQWQFRAMFTTMFRSQTWLPLHLPH